MKYYLILFGLLILISCNQKSHDKIIITEEAEKLFEKGVRTQIISFDGIQLIDSAKSIYIIPVGQRYLDKEENIESQGGLGLISSGRYDDRFYGENNYVLFYKNTKKTINIFNKRYILRLLDIKKVKEDIKLIFNGTNNDSIVQY